MESVIPGEEEPFTIIDDGVLNDFDFGFEEEDQEDADETARLQAEAEREAEEERLAYELEQQLLADE